MIPKGIMKVQIENDDTEEGLSKQTLDDQEIVPVEEVEYQHIEFYRNKDNWVHAEQSRIYY